MFAAGGRRPQRIAEKDTLRGGPRLALPRGPRAQDGQSVLVTSDANTQLAGIVDALARREPLFHRPEFGTTRDDFDAMIAEGFWEIGASGQRYSRVYVLDVLEQRHQQPHEDPWSTADFHCQQIAPEIFLVTYTLQQSARVTRRSTLWHDTADGWKALFHQGTEVQNDSPVR